MIIIAGDIHGEFWALNNLINKHSEITMIIQCGDFGWWPRCTFDFIDKRENYKLKNHDVTIFWCDGNHEDFEDLNKYKTKTEVLPNIFYMPRGTVMELPDKRKILFIGGGLSIDKHLRIPRSENFGWFEEETITQRDIENLPDENIDIIISHTAPEYFTLNDWYKDGRYPVDPSRKALDYVFDKYHPSLWFFGHMHKYQKGVFKRCKWTGLSSVGFSGRWWDKLQLEEIISEE
jgi:Icc-related predicted phosphoesterase